MINKNKYKNVLIIPGWYQKPMNNWYPWLAHYLNEKGYEVMVPDLPTMNTQQPKMDHQLEFIINRFELSPKSVVVGHSLGALLGLRLAERYRFEKLILVAGWDFDDLTEGHRLYWKKPIRHEVIKKNIKKIFCMCSENDQIFGKYTTQAMTKRLNGQIIVVRGAGHFTQKDGVKKILALQKIV